MPSRRKVLSVAAAGTLGSIAGCSSLTAGADPLPVAVLLHNDDTDARELRVVVTADPDERVFETTETIPADDGTGLGRVRIDSAFEGRPGDEFTVRAWFDGESTRSFDYEVTCPEDNYVALLVDHRPDQGGGEPVQYNDHWCAN
jgi:hypothetical protein